MKKKTKKHQKPEISIFNLQVRSILNLLEKLGIQSSIAYSSESIMEGCLRAMGNFGTPDKYFMNPAALKKFTKNTK